MARNDDSNGIHPEPWPEDVSKVVPGAKTPDLYPSWESSGRPVTEGDVRQPVDADAATRVRDDILSDLRVMVEDLRVSAEQGRLRVQGRVPCEADRDHILRKAAAIVGATCVVDQLAVAS